ncbi:MAG: nitrate- and nitrite sensing domain-containing protein, partial [Rhodospirillales bacterium]|nr:nitrate- and nitrite sensing domain-containing protein [Rhodospirillales bacterium]
MNINPRLRYYPIGVRITLSVLLPMLGLLMLAGWIIADKWTLARTADRLQEMAGLASRLSAVVHELQRERGSSALFLGSKGTAFKEQLATQRRATDASRTILEGSLAKLDPAIRGTLDRKLEVVGKDTREMLARRNDIDAVSVDPREAIALYTRTVGDVISIVKDLALSSPDAQVGNRIAAYVNLMEGKERAGQERATGSAGFAAGKFPPDLYRRYIALAAEENAFYSVFRTFAAPEVTAFFERTLSGEVVSEVERFRKIAYDSAFTGHTGEVKAPDWFAAATRRIDVLKTIEDRIAADLAGIALDVTRSAYATLWGTLAFTVLLLAGGAFLALAMIQGTTRPLHELTAVMSRLAAARRPGG